jgi:hypothetical protein
MRLTTFPRCGEPLFFGSFLIIVAEVISGCDTGIRKITGPNHGLFDSVLIEQDDLDTGFFG